MTAPIIVFHLGSPKTGTTLIARLLDQHPDVCVINESWALREGHEHSLLNPDGDWWRKHGFTREQVVEWRAMKREDAVRAYCAEYARIRGARVVIESWPLWYQATAHLALKFPSSPWLYNVRDPRATYWSGHTFESMQHGPLVLGMALEAERNVMANRKHPAVMCRYEDVVTNTESEVRRMWSELGVDPALGWIEYDPARDPHPERWSWIKNSTSAPDPARLRRWFDEMPAIVQEQVTNDTIDFVREWNYTPAHRPGPGTVLKRWLDGEPLKNIRVRGSKVSPEDFLREEFRNLLRAATETRADLRMFGERLNEMIHTCEGTDATDTWERYWLVGYRDACLTAADTAGHMNSRILKRLLRPA